MAFPSIAATNTTNGAAATNKSCNLPSGIQSGNLLLLWIRSNGADTHTTPSGWSDLVKNNTADASDDTTSLFYKIASGSEGSTVTVNGTASLKFSSLSWRVTGAHQTTAPNVATATGTSSTPDPPSLTPSGGTKDYLWIAIYGIEGTSTLSSYPANYSSNQITVATSGSTAATNSRSGAAARQLNASSENPGTFTASASEDWTAVTVAVYPATDRELTASITEGADTASAETAVDVSASLSATEGADTVSSAGTVVVSASASITEAGDTLTGYTQTVEEREITASITEGADSLSSSSAVSVSVSLSAAEGADAVSASGSVEVSASASVQEGGDTSSSSATVAVSASLSAQEGADSASSQAAVSVSASASISESGDTAQAQATVSVSASASINEAGDTLSASASVLPAIELWAAINEEADSASAQASVSVSASAGLAEDGDSLASAAAVSSGPEAWASLDEGADTVAGQLSVAILVFSTLEEEADGAAASALVRIPYVFSGRRSAGVLPGANRWTVYRGKTSWVVSRGGQIEARPGSRVIAVPATVHWGQPDNKGRGKK